MNRVLKHLRNERLVEVERKNFTLRDMVKLEALSQFDRAYLHQDPAK
jgi:hypothetical protein